MPPTITALNTQLATVHQPLIIDEAAHNYDIFMLERLSGALGRKSLMVQTPNCSFVIPCMKKRVHMVN